MAEPIPLQSARALPPFPIDALPPVFAAEVEALAEFTQTDPGMAGTSALSVLAACAGGRCELEIKPGWREPTNIFTATIAEPGERKSAVQQTMVGPVLAAEKELVKAAEKDRIEALVLKNIATKAAEKATNEAGAARGDDKKNSAFTAITAALTADEMEVPPVPRIVADDVTPEAAGSLLAEQSGRLAIISSEGGIFDILAGRYTGSANLDVFLKGHAGDVLKVDRKGRPPEYVARPALTVGVMIQPAVLIAIAKNGTFRGRGLLARFLFSQPPSIVGYRNIDAPAVPDHVQAAYDDAVTVLATTMAGWKDPAVLKLEPAALEALMAFAREIEPQLQPAAGLSHIRDWASKLIGATARIAALIHLGANPVNGWRSEVKVESVLNAISVARYFTSHALAAFDAMAADPVVADAMYLLEIINRERMKTFSKRDLFTKASRSRFPKVSDLDVVISKLEEHLYIDEEPRIETSGRGRPPSPTWRVNPAHSAAVIADIAERRGSA